MIASPAMRTYFMPSWMRVALPTAIVALVVVAAACSDATGSVEGGQALALPTVAPGDSGTSGSGASEAGSTGCPPSGTPKFSELYSCYFSTCSTMGCHSTTGDDGSLISGFVCGTTASSCAMGMTSSSTSMAPIVPSSGAKDGTTTGLYACLNKGGASGGASNNMPLVPSMVFSKADLAAIDAWIQAGAPNN